MYTKTILAVITACIIAYIITPKVIILAKKIGAVDKPNERKVHKKIMPRLGGLAIYLAFVAAILIYLPITPFIKALLSGSTIIVLLGILDDVKGLPPKGKLLGQIIAALVVVLYGVKVQFVTSPFEGVIFLGKLAIPFTILWIVGVTNAVNLIDGLDGLAAGVSAIAAFTMAVIGIMEGQIETAVLSFILCGAILGFLKYNFNPASIFMGDTGSMFLGFTLSLIAIQGLTKGATIISIFIPVVILGIPIFDTAFAIIRRLIKGNPIFEADKEHLHHMLLNLGLSHKQTVLTIYGVSTCLAGSAILLNILSTDQSIIILIALTVISIFLVNRVSVLVAKKQEQKARHSIQQEQDFHNFGG